METGYKIFDENLQCRGFQYEIGKTYQHDDKIEMCKSGFHFCLNPTDLFNYYYFDSKNRVCIIEFDENDVIHGGSKSVTGKIKIVEELSWEKVLTLVNSGDGNSGYGNSGCQNSGYWNSGNRNSGNRNSGDRNSGHLNSGRQNSGNRNSGDRNSGDWNSCNYSNGIFCSEQQKLAIFNKQTNITHEDFYNDDKYKNIRRVLYNYNFPLTYWDEENEILLTLSYKQACAIWWDSIPPNLKEEFVNWEYFDASVFEEITGIRV